MDLRERAIRAMNDLGHRRVPFLFVVDFEENAPVILPLSDVDPSECLYDFNGTTNFPCHANDRSQFHFLKSPVSFEEYRRAFLTVREALREGESYLLNLTFPTPLETDLTLRDIAIRSSAKYRLYLRDRCVVFSPETFVRIAGGVISSFPMKGTIDASLPNAATVLLSDEKEFAEHTTIVDLIRNDLSTIAEGVHVTHFRFIDHLRTNQKDLLQVSSEIVGTLRNGFASYIGDILFSLLPAGSVTGAPKKRTVEIIRKVEVAPRGFYTGVAGCFDGEHLESCVLIRYIEQTPSGLVYRSGGGITVYSDVEKEYAEMKDKVYVPIV